MAIRIREDGTMVCAAKSEKMDGDKYLDDGLHEMLGSCLPESLDILIVLGIDDNGAEIWGFKNKSLVEKLQKTLHTNFLTSGDKFFTLSQVGKAIDYVFTNFKQINELEEV